MNTMQFVEATPRITRWLTFAHFANDFFSGSIGILLVALKGTLELSATQIGLAAGLFQGVSLIQPLLGWLTDRIERSYLMLIGAFITAFGLFLCAMSTEVWMLYAGATLGGVGNAMFHPIGLAGARAFAQKNAAGRSVAVFMLGGNSGFAVGPLVLGILLDNIGLKSLAPLVILSAFVVPFLMWQVRPYLRGNISAAKKSTKARTRHSGGRWWQTAAFMLAMYMLAVFLRGTIHQSLGTYLPLFYEEQDRTLTFAGMATSLLLFFAALGSYAGASLSDYVSRRLIMLVSMASMTPLLLLLLNADGVWIFVLSMGLGLMVNANWPIMLMIGQELFPGKAASASGFAFGWGFFASAAGSFVVGVMADAIGLAEALTIIAFMPLIASSLVFFFPSGDPEPEPPRQPEAAEIIAEQPA